MVRLSIAKQIAQIFFIFALLLPFLGMAEHSSNHTEVISTRRDVKMNIHTGGDIDVEEVWEIFFPYRDRPFHKGYREILLNKIDQITGWHVFEKEISYDDEGLAITEEAPLAIEINQTKEASRCTWFFHDTTNAIKTFVIRYKLKGVLRVDDVHDELFYTVVEPGRTYRILQSTVTIVFPSEVQNEQLRVASYIGGKEIKLDFSRQARELQFRHGGLLATEDWAIRVQFPHTVTISSQPDWQHQEKRLARFNLIGLTASALILFGGGFFVFLLWYLKGRDKPFKDPTVMLTELPDTKPPGLVGVLIDERVHFRHVLATIFDLARRGFLQIQEQTRDNALFIRKKVANAKSSLLLYEWQVLEELFNRKEQVELLDLRYEFGKAIPALKEALSNEAAAQGDFVEAPENARLKYVAIGALGLFLSVAFMGVAASLLGTMAGIFVSVSLALVSVFFMIVSRFMPKHTDKGVSSLVKWRGFSTYLTELKEYTNTEQAQQQFEQFLPYAIALGMEKTLVQAFSGLEIASPPWYVPRGMNDSSSITYASSGGSSVGMEGSVSSSGGSFGLDSMSHGLFSMLNSAASVLTETKTERSSSDSSWSSSGDSSSGGDSSGGGSSGFD